MKQFMNDSMRVTRRYFFEECGVGVGKIALGALLGGMVGRAGFCRGGRGGESAGGSSTAFCAQGETGDSSVHGGSAEPSRLV